MKKAMRFFLMIVLSCLPAGAAEERGTVQSSVPDHTGVEIMGVPANGMGLSYTLNDGSTGVLAQKAAMRSPILDQMLQSEAFRAFSREQLSFTPDWGSFARVSQGPELLAYRHGVMPVQQGATRNGDRNQFAVKSNEYAVIPVQYPVVEPVADSRTEAKRSNGRKSGGSMWMMRIVV